MVLQVLLNSVVISYDHRIKAVGSGKAVKALALPDFPPSVQLLY